MIKSILFVFLSMLVIAWAFFISLGYAVWFDDWFASILFLGGLWTSILTDYLERLTK